MIGSKQLAAVLTTAKNLDDRLILRFQQINKTDGEGAVSDERQHAELREQTARIEALAEKVRQADQRATLTKEYIDFLRRTRDRKATAADDAMDTGLDSHELVEDLMADLR